MKKSMFSVLTLTLLIAGFVNILNAQGRQGFRGGVITGQIVNAADNEPIEYAYIILYSKRDSAQAAGTVTEKDGRFLLKGLRPGGYYLDVQFMGFQKKTINDIQLGRGKMRFDLDIIELKEIRLSTEKIEVVAERAPISYQIDKKVINVSKQHTVISGTAVDVLENVPSVTVDIEGNVELRGSSSFLVLIDNRPSILDANDALQQIPASVIETIEIITNPSAKFDPDGNAGIINIITKKSRLRGINAIVNANLGLDEKYGGDFVINYRNRNFNVYFGADFNKRMHPGSREEERRTTIADTTLYVNYDGTSKRGRTTYSLRGGFDFNLTPKDIFSLGVRYGDRESEHNSLLDYEEWSAPGTGKESYFSRSFSERSRKFYAVNLDYRHNFNNNGHALAAQFMMQKREGEEKAKDELLNSMDEKTGGRISTETGPSEPLRFKIDYTLPLGNSNKFEAGLQSRLRSSQDITELYDFVVDSNRYIIQPQYGHEIEYLRNVHSVYSLYSAERGAFGFQGGLRFEYTDRLIKMLDLNKDFALKRWDFFPTAHLSWKFVQGQQMMASYTRRIKRPRGWSFEPFETWMDAYNVRIGNPDIKPEYIDSYEMGYQTYFGKNLFSAETYYRITNNKIERVRSVYEANVTLHTTENVGTDYTLGSEVMLNMDAFKFWNINLMGNFYQYRIEGVLHDRSFSRDSFNWGVRFNNTLRLGQLSRFQLNAMYNSPSVSSQGTREGYVSVNLGYRQEFFKRKLSATVQVRDIFSTAKREYTTEGLNFYSHGIFTRKAPVAMLTLSYKINKPKEEKQRERGNEEFEDDEEF